MSGGHQETIKSNILRDVRTFIETRGFRSGTDFSPEDRMIRRDWHAVPGHIFLAEFMEKYRDYVDYYVEVNEVIEDDIGQCYKINP